MLWRVSEYPFVSAPFRILPRWRTSVAVFHCVVTVGEGYADNSLPLTSTENVVTASFPGNSSAMETKKKKKRRVVPKGWSTSSSLPSLTSQQQHKQQQQQQQHQQQPKPTPTMPKQAAFTGDDVCAYLSSLPRGGATEAEARARFGPGVVAVLNELSDEYEVYLGKDGLFRPM